MTDLDQPSLFQPQIDPLQTMASLEGQWLLASDSELALPFDNLLRNISRFARPTDGLKPPAFLSITSPRMDPSSSPLAAWVTGMHSSTLSGFFCPHEVIVTADWLWSTFLQTTCCAALALHTWAGSGIQPKRSKPQICTCVPPWLAKFHSFP